MSILKKLSLGAAGAVVVATALAANPVQAFTIASRTYTLGSCPSPDGCKSNLAGATTIDFNNNASTTTNFTTGLATYIFNTNTALRTGNSNGVYASPAGDSTQFLAIGLSPNATLATINFSSPVNYFGLYWASIDPGNTITFSNTSTGTSRVVTGSNIFANADGGQTQSDTNRYVDFFTDNPSESFNRVQLSSTVQAFENDNHAYRQAAVPEPLTILGSGMALCFGILMKREHSRKHQNT